MPTAITNLFNNINWTAPSWDLFIVIFFIVAAFLYCLSLGRNRILVILISVYIALALVNAFPFSEKVIGQFRLGDTFVLKITLFAGIILILFFLLSRSALSSAMTTRRGGSWFQVLIFSFLHVGLLISLVLSFVPKEFVENLAPFTRKIFTTDTARFLWLLLPIVAMCLLKGRRRRRRAEEM